MSPARRMLSCLGTATDLLDIPRQTTRQAINLASYIHSTQATLHMMYIHNLGMRLQLTLTNRHSLTAASQEDEEVS